MAYPGGMIPHRLSGGGDIAIAQPTQTDADNQEFTFSQTTVVADDFRLTKDSEGTRLGFHGIAGKTTSETNLFDSGAVTTLNDGDESDTKTPAQVFSMGIDGSGQFRNIIEEGEKAFIQFALDTGKVPRYVDVWKVITSGAYNDITVQINGESVEFPEFDFGFDQSIFAGAAGTVIGAGYSGAHLYRLYFEGGGASITVYPRYFRVMNLTGTDTTHRPPWIKVFDASSTEITTSHGLRYGPSFDFKVPQNLIDGSAETWDSVSTGSGYGLGVVTEAEYGAQIGSYKMRSRDSVGYRQMANAWDEQISFDGIWWFTVGTKSGITWAAGEEKTFTIGA